MAVCKAAGAQDSSKSEPKRKANVDEESDVEEPGEDRSGATRDRLKMSWLNNHIGQLSPEMQDHIGVFLLIWNVPFDFLIFSH